MKRIIKSMSRVHLPVGRITRPLFGVLYHLHVLARVGIAFLLRMGWYEPLFRSQCAAIGRRFEMEQLPYVTGRGRIELGDQVRLSGKSSIGFSSRFSDAPVLSIGNHCFVGHQCAFVVGRSITIGNDCLIAGGVRISDFDGHPLDADERRSGMPAAARDVRPVVIGDDVWIGHGAMILKGVTIGDRTVIGARAVVTKDVPADCVVAGNPARVVKRLLSDASEKAA